MSCVGLLEYLLRRATRTRQSLDEEEMRSAGYYALCRAARNYDPAKGKFSSYCSYAIYTQWRTSVKQKRRLPMTFAGDVIDTYWSDAANDDASRREELESVMRHLKPVEKQVIRMHVESHTDAEIATVVRLSRQRVHQIRHEAMEKMRNAIT